MIEQIIILIILATALLLFSRSGWRYDFVALIVLLLIILSGILPLSSAFAGFSHPAIFIVASMFVLSQALVNSGLIDIALRKLTGLSNNPIIELSILTVLVAVASAFINDIGALALVMPIAINLAKKSQVSPAMFLLPIAFASHLGGFLTLIGTPRNIIISAFRESTGAPAFGMFDFAYVGGGLALVIILFLVFVSWRLLPKRPFNLRPEMAVDDYVSEVSLPAGKKYLVEYINDLKESIEGKVSVVALLRENQRFLHPSGLEEIKPEDTLIIKADPETLTELVEINKLNIVGQRAKEGTVSGEDEDGDLEAVIGFNSPIIDRSWSEIKWPLRFGVNLLAVARHGETIKKPLNQVRFQVGDVLLLKGLRESVLDTIAWLKLLPLAERPLSFGRPKRAFLALGIFALAIFFSTSGILPLVLAFLLAATAMIWLKFISLRQAYETINWPVIILLGSMITLGLALETSGGAATLADGLIWANQYLPAAAILGLVLLISMLLSDFVNATASAVIMSPVVIFLATSLGFSIDPFLMAVAIGASSSFLSPTGHESNAIVMGPGGYKYFDYFRVGLPLEILILLISLPLLLYFWPL